MSVLLLWLYYKCKTWYLQKIVLVTIQATAHHHCVSVNGSSYDCQIEKVGVGTSGYENRSHYDPVYLGGVCHRAVDGVEYLVTHNGSSGVRRVDVHFHHRDVPEAGRPIYFGQRFNVRFVWATVRSTVESYERSGKPGYITGSPLLVTMTDKDVMNNRRPKTMLLPEPDGSGTCVHSTSWSRQSINFLESVDVQCRVRVLRRNMQLSKRAGDHFPPSGGVSFADICNDVQNEVYDTTFLFILYIINYLVIITITCKLVVWYMQRPTDSNFIGCIRYVL